MLDFTDGNMSYPNPFPQDSELYFRVVERPIGWFNERTKEHVRITKQKALVRAAAGGGMWLANVGENYKLIENRDLFPHVEQHITHVIKPEHVAGVTVRDSMSYGGRDCYREYLFKNLTIPNKPDVAFKLMVGNSYGAKAVQCMYGAEDGFCSNGMIFGTAEKHARKHTSGLTLSGVEDWINGAVRQFTIQGQRIERYDATYIDLAREDGLFDYLVSKNLLSAQRATQAQWAMHQERNKRQGRDTRPTLWHLYSALTDWASHSDVRKTDNDHTANTRIQRTMHAERVIKEVDRWISA